jgi:hypothetical protein
LGDFANLATATAVDQNVVAQLTEANSHLSKQLEDNVTSLKEVRALLKKSDQNVLGVAIQNVPLAAPSQHPRITIAGHTVTNWHIPIQAKLVFTQRKGTNMKKQRPTIWEGPNSTCIDLQGRHLKIIMKKLTIVVPHPRLNTMTQPLLTQFAQGIFFYQMLRV